MRLNGVEVTVSVNGQDLKEYDDDGDDDVDGAVPENTRTSYVEAVAGTAFIIKYKCLPEFKQPPVIRGIVAAVYIDKLKGESTAAIRQFPYAGDIMGAMTGKGDKYSIRPFQFSDIQIVEAESKASYKSQAALVKSLGKIRVTIQRVRLVYGTQPATYWREGPESTPHAISEKALKGKALSLGASLGPSKSTRPFLYQNTANYDISQSPYATFVFKYRTRKSLHDLMIIPRSPSPLPLEDRPREQLTREELLELLNRTAPIKEEDKKQRAGTKRKRDVVAVEEEDPERDELLRSARSAPQPAPEVIDLTD